MISPTDDSFKHSLLGLVQLFTQIFGIDKKKKRIHEIVMMDKTFFEKPFQLAPKARVALEPILFG